MQDDFMEKLIVDMLNQSDKRLSETIKLMQETGQDKIPIEQSIFGKNLPKPLYDFKVVKCNCSEDCPLLKGGDK